MDTSVFHGIMGKLPHIGRLVMTPDESMGQEDKGHDFQEVSHSFL
jgi:hypothetical protein